MDSTLKISNVIETSILYTKLTLIFLFLLLGFAGTVALCGADEIPLALDTLGVGLGRKGVVGVVGVPGGVWLGVEGVDVALPGVTTDDWLSDRIDTGGIAWVNTSQASKSFFTSNAKSTIYQHKKPVVMEY